MPVSKYNPEGYYDPTAYQALNNILDERKNNFRPIVYICSPFAGNARTNKRRARQYCLFAIQANAIPVAPNLYFPKFLDENDEDARELGQFMALVLLTKCRELWWFGDEITPQMRREIEKAKYRQIPVRHFTLDLKEVTPDE